MLKIGVRICLWHHDSDNTNLKFQLYLPDKRALCTHTPPGLLIGLVLSSSRVEESRPERKGRGEEFSTPPRGMKSEKRVMFYARLPEVLARAIRRHVEA